jgi:hypothetical protein
MILLAKEIEVELPDGMHDLEEELPAHPETAAKHVLSMEWLVDEVVGVQHALALYPLSRLALPATWRRTTVLWLHHLHVQLGDRCEDLQVLFTFSDLGALLLQEYGEHLLVVGVHGRIRSNAEHLADVVVGAHSKAELRRSSGDESGSGEGVEVGINYGERI